MRRATIRPLSSLLILAAIFGSDGRPFKAAAADQPVSTVRYACQQNKTIVAQYFNGPSSTAPNGQPIPGGRVDVSLSDGRKLRLPQTLSASGIRYADPAETVVFWSKGDTAFVEEGKARTYADCLAVKG